MTYDFAKIEKKWQDIWDKENTFAAKNDYYACRNIYALVEFPYPSGQGLHVGTSHVAYTALDIVARKRRLEGLQCAVSHGLGCFWPAYRKLCD